jgi:hypothetical protein
VSDQIVGLDPLPDRLASVRDSVQTTLPSVLGYQEFDEGVVSQFLERTGYVRDRAIRIARDL